MNKLYLDNYKRINKTNAKKAFLAGDVVTVTACKIDPRNIYGVGVSNISLARCEDINGAPLDDVGRINVFNNLINSFIFYNCNYECGYYPAFYINE